MAPQIRSRLSSQLMGLRLSNCNAVQKQRPLCLRLSSPRTITSNEKPLAKAQKDSPGPNQQQQPHVSEEAAATAKIMGEKGPELEQGTPIQEVLSRDEKAKGNAPKVLKEEAKLSSPNGSRQYSTSARLWVQDIMKQEPTVMQKYDRGDGQAISGQKPAKVQTFEEGEGHLFGLPELPLPSKLHIRHRYDPIVEQVTNLIMQSGKLSQAQRTVAMILERLRTAAPPSANPQRPLLPGAPPTTHLPLNPVLYLALAIDSVAPLMRIRSQKGAAGGGVALQLPVPLTLKQRRRTAIKWILDAASKRKSKGSGRSMFANKVADELIAIIEGKSGVWERRSGIHKLGVNARANLNVRIRR